MDVIKQRDEGATLVKVFLSPVEHQILKVLANDYGGMSHLLRLLAVKWLTEQNAIAQQEETEG